MTKDGQDHDWRHTPVPGREAELRRIHPTAPVERLAPWEGSGVFQHRFCVAHPGEEVIQEVPERVFD